MELEAKKALILLNDCVKSQIWFTMFNKTDYKKENTQ